MVYDVFISYSRKDLSLIEPLVKDIEKRANVRCWIDWNGIESGSQFEDVIVKAIDSVKVVLFFLSENSMNSKYAKMEVNYADNTRKKVVPIVLDGGSLRGWFLFKFGSVDFIDVNQERQYNKLINDLIGWCGTAPQVVSQETPQIERSTPAPPPAPQPQSAPGPRPTVVRTATLHEVSTVKSTRQAQQSYKEAWAKWHAQRDAKSYKVGDYYDESQIAVDTNPQCVDVPERKEMNHDVFISYSRKDSEIVNQICALLKENGIEFWIDKDGIYSGGRFKGVIVDAIETAKVVLFVSSENSNRSPNVVKEISIAAVNDKIIVPLKLDEASYDKNISYDISSIDHIEYSAIDFKQRLVRSLKGAIEKSKL